jgi:hypothetical protein
LLQPSCAKDSISKAEASDKIKPTGDEIRAIAEEGFIYGLPLVMNYAVNYEFWVDKSSPQYKNPINQLYQEHRVFTPQDTAVVTPNSDTPYSFAAFDLRAEPWVLTVPEVAAPRYYSLQFTDWNTFNIGYVGTRATGRKAGNYLLVGPGWSGKTPAGMSGVIRSTTDFCIVIYRTQLFGADDMPNVMKVQSGYKAQTLSAFMGKPLPATPLPTFPPINKEMVKTNFFEYLDFVLQFAPAGKEEKEIRAKLARIGIGPGKKFDFKELSLMHKLELAEGMKAGEKKVDEKVAKLGTIINGWNVGSAFGDRKFYNGDWLLRAAAAKAGIYGNDAIEATYLLTREDVSGGVLDGSKGKYTITFPAGKLPPVNAFWSITMYDGKSQLLVENPINRYLINSPMLPGLKKNADGSLTLYIQSTSPGADKESNWLPAPNDTIYMVMRLYWPKTEAPSVLPVGKGTWQPPGVVKVK